jgi:hypothetical protein
MTELMQRLRSKADIRSDAECWPWRDAVNYNRIKPCYYSEWDAPTAAWLRELIARGLIAPGEAFDAFARIIGVPADEFRNVIFPDEKGNNDGNR